jgi:hypothetical protein
MMAPPAADCAPAAHISGSADVYMMRCPNMVARLGKGRSEMSGKRQSLVKASTAVSEAMGPEAPTAATYWTGQDVVAHYRANGTWHGGDDQMTNLYCPSLCGRCWSCRQTVRRNVYGFVSLIAVFALSATGLYVNFGGY